MLADLRLCGWHVLTPCCHRHDGDPTGSLQADAHVTRRATPMRFFIPEVLLCSQIGKALEEEFKHTTSLDQLIATNDQKQAVKRVPRGAPSDAARHIQRLKILTGMPYKCLEAFMLPPW